MAWKPKLEQLVGLLEKVPQPKSFDAKEGVYEPYFLIELRSSNWEIVPFASYTRLDGSPGREVRLALSVVDSSKVNISQDELDALIYLESGSSPNSRAIFNYTQPVGFLLNWLKNSRLMVNENGRSAIPITRRPGRANLITRLKKKRGGYVLQPSLVFDNGDIVVIEGSAVILSSNPIYLLHKNVLYELESALPAVFWSNYFRIRDEFAIPTADLGEFIRVYLPHILPVFDWDNLGDNIKQESFPMTEKRIEFNEWNNNLQIDVRFVYDKHEFPGYPASDRSLANKGQNLFVVLRDKKEEEASLKMLEENGLILRSGSWNIAAEYNTLDWMRLIIPKLSKAGFTFVNEDSLKRFRVHRQKPKLKFKVKSGIDWLDLTYAAYIGREQVEIPDLLQQLQNGKDYLRLSDGSHVYLEEEQRESLKQFALFLDLKNGTGDLRLPVAGIALVKELQGLTDLVSLDNQADKLVAKYQQFKEITPQEPPKGLNATLRNYQQAGLDWLYFLYDFNFGGILADDMGLGKTIQVISLLLKAKEKKSLKGPGIIVVPLTLIFNWWEEFHKFAPSIKVLRYYGSKAERKKLAATFDDYDVILCSYGVVLQDQKTLSARDFDFIILDESQKIKNPQTKTYKAIEKLQTRHKLALTGTPVENSLIDLWAQMNFTNPGMLGTLKQFQRRYVDIPDEDREEQIEALRKIVYPFILRRTKEEVEKELPPLTEIVQYVDMTDSQRKTYNQWLSHYRNEIFESLESVGINQTRLKVVEALTYLRQVACHPAILDEEIDLQDAGKVELLEDMLRHLVHKGHKVLIFSQFVRFLALIRKVMEKNEWKYEYLDGKTRNRAKRIHSFQENEKVTAFLISLKAGGLGLNLTAADYVIHLDPWWNPAVEQQATDRAHRIGQKKRVFSYKYIVKDSVEEKILLLQERKKQLSEELITSDSGFVKALSPEDLEMLFAVEKNGKLKG